MIKTKNHKKIKPSKCANW